MTSDLPMRVIWKDLNATSLRRVEAPAGYNNVETDYYEGGDTNVIYKPYELCLQRSISLPDIMSRHSKKMFGDRDIDDDLLDRYDKLRFGMQLRNLFLGCRRGSYYDQKTRPQG